MQIAVESQNQGSHGCNLMIKRPDQKLCFALKLTKPKCKFLKRGTNSLSCSYMGKIRILFETQFH